MRDAKFGSVVGLVRWHLGLGRQRMGGLKAIDYEPRAGGARDFWATERTHQLFALTSRCLAAAGAEGERLLLLAYGLGLSDMKIASRARKSESTIRRLRGKALRAIAERAVELDGVARAQLGRSLIGGDE